MNRAPSRPRVPLDDSVQRLTMVRLSIVVPVYNEEANVPILVDEIREALGEEAWELLIVDDGSTDGTRDAVRALAADDPRVRLLALARNYGQSAAMQAGFDRATRDDGNSQVGKPPE